MFRITWAYWSDSGKPTVNNESPSSETGNLAFEQLLEKEINKKNIKTVYKIVTNHRKKFQLDSVLSICESLYLKVTTP